MKNTFNLKDINMHIVLVTKIYNYDITITYTNNYNMHFFENLGIKFLDHIIFATDKTYSFRNSGLLEMLKSGINYQRQTQ